MSLFWVCVGMDPLQSREGQLDRALIVGMVNNEACNFVTCSNVLHFKRSNISAGKKYYFVAILLENKVTFSFLK